MAKKQGNQFYLGEHQKKGEVSRGTQIPTEIQALRITSYIYFPTVVILQGKTKQEYFKKLWKMCTIIRTVYMGSLLMRTQEHVCNESFLIKVVCLYLQK